MSEQFYDEDKARQQEKVAATPDMVAQRRAMLELLDLKEGEHVLDVGSGNGIFAREILETVTDSGHVCGIDSAEPMVAMATDICPAGKFLQGDATDPDQISPTARLNVSSKSVGDESITYRVGAIQSTEDDYLSLTNYGVQYLRLRKRAGMGAIAV